MFQTERPECQFKKSKRNDSSVKEVLARHVLVGADLMPVFFTLERLAQPRLTIG